jgi:hypothetical protein
LVWLCTSLHVVEESVPDSSAALMTMVDRGSFEAGEGPGGTSGRATHRGRRRLLLACGVLIVAFLTATAVLFVFPATDQPRHVDAILSLNGSDEPARESKAISLAKEGYAHVLLFSQGNSPTPCPKVAHIKVVCFIAIPGRTVGEVRFAADYARRYGWRSLMVVPGRAQATRARLLLKRCFQGRILIVPAPFYLVQYPYEVVYEWGALGKALFVDRHC